MRRSSSYHPHVSDEVRHALQVVRSLQLVATLGHEPLYQYDDEHEPDVGPDDEPARHWPVELHHPHALSALHDEHDEYDEQEEAARVTKTNENNGADGRTVVSVAAYDEGRGWCLGGRAGGEMRAGSGM